MDAKTIARFLSKCEYRMMRPDLDIGPCLVWTRATTRYGYGVFRLCGKNDYAHRLSYVQFVGDLPQGLFVCHRCDTPQCLRPAHLFPGDALKNSGDMVSKGRSSVGDKNGSRTTPESVPRGEDRYNAKLTPDAIRTIRDMRRSGSLQQDIADAMGVTQGTISEILSGKKWGQVF